MRRERVLAEVPARERLSAALDAVLSGEAEGLAADRLEDLAGSLAELAALLRWLREAAAALLVRELGFDTTAPGGRRTVDLLLALEEIERRNRPPRPPPPGRPKVGPALRERIARMREEGMTLQAIADTLNGEGVPTPRGGAKWRPSSVQNAAGYSRPGPPGPLPPPPRPPPPRRP